MTNDSLNDILAGCLEAIEQGESAESCLARHPEHREALSGLLLTAQAARRGASYQPRPGQQAASRARLVRRISEKAPNKAAPRLAWQFRFAATWAVVLALLLSALGSGTVYASNSALPGDTLYPIKLSVEEARLAFSQDDEQALQLAMEFIHTRAEESRALVQAGRPEDLPLLQAALDNRIETATAALQAISMQDAERAVVLGQALEETLAENTLILNELSTSLPAEAQPALEKALNASERGQQAIRRIFGEDPPGGGPPEQNPGQGAPNPDGGPPSHAPGRQGPPETPGGEGGGNPNPAGNPPGGAPTSVPGPPGSPGNRP